MKPIKFKEANKTLTKPTDMSDKQCKSLPILHTGNLCISCWKMSLEERIQFLFIGEIWLTVRSGQTQPPVKLNLEKPFSGKCTRVGYDLYECSCFKCIKLDIERENKSIGT